MCIRKHKLGATIQVRVTPRAGMDAISGSREGVLLLRLKAPPAEGRANRDLIKFLAKKLGVRPSAMSILKGKGSREKVLLLEGEDPVDLAKRLDAAIARERT